MADWKDTLNLPRTQFPMKANLQAAEPKTIERWESTDLYGRLRARRKGAPQFILHDGPPYANGRIHLGTAFNKILKDFVVRSRSMAGYDAPYVPGWDCHGLPIELKVDRELGAKKRDLSIGDFRRACRAYASKFVDIQRADFRRLGVMGAWMEPYLTMNYSYQGAIVRALGKFVEKGMVYKGKKPVHWCIHCRTALAEAEVEYENHSSPSIFVEFPVAPEGAAELAKRIPELAGKPVSVLIWTTTPWTIPSNLAIAFHPTFTYGAYPVGDGVVIVAEGLAEKVSQQVKRPFGAPLATFTGDVLEGVLFQHPLYKRTSVGVLADYVTLDAGTGAVHTAPGHGADDFNTGVKYGLEVYAPVGPTGHFLDEVEIFAGQRVFDANPTIEEALKNRGRLWHRETFEHSYPHCWRCHNPVIFLATWQWFISMDATGLRQMALDAVEKVTWTPSWGEERIHNMLANRPDWCISRQRSWGVPIPAVDCAKCHEAVLTPAQVDRAAAVFDEHGADAWYERPIEEFLPPDLACPKCGHREFERERDILDVWFDSGSSHEAVLGLREGLRWPADLYLEGTDQYRGWFHSSLLVGLGTRDHAPYRGVLTHGFVVDKDGRKMSKSIGNTVEPQEVIAKSGAEILRLWSAMSDFREEVRIGPEILARIVEAYLKLRNTLRILAANLGEPAPGTAPRADEFRPGQDRVPYEQMLELDRFALARYADVAQRIVQAYEAFDFPAVPQLLNAFATVDLSAFYVDVSKDRLYTFAPKSLARRSAQTAMFIIVDGLARLIAPILPITADELWRHLPGERDDSVHLAVFPQDLDTFADGGLVERWQRLLKVREAVNVEIEKIRQSKVVGKSLEVKVTLRPTGGLAALLEQYRGELPTLFITSVVELAAANGEAGAVYAENDDSRVTIEVSRADGVRCDRCWRYVPAVGAETAVEGLCPRCQQALAEARA